MECTCCTAVVTIDLSNSGVRCKPSSYSSAAVRQLCHPQREATSISAGVSFAGHTAACCELQVSGVPCMFSSFKKATRTDIPIVLPTDPFFWSSRRGKSYFHQVKVMRHETDGELNNATRYRRSCSDTEKLLRSFLSNCVK